MGSTSLGVILLIVGTALLVATRWHVNRFGTVNGAIGIARVVLTWLSVIAGSIMIFSGIVALFVPPI